MAAPSRLILVAALLLGGVRTATCAVLCGSVSDGATGQPVANAGVFVRDTTGADLHLYAATDGLGRFCLSPIAPGRYDLEIRRDDYATAYRRVTVTEATASVELAIASDPLRFAAPAPNPSAGAVRLAWMQARDGAVTLRIVDVLGRDVRTWSGPSSAGTHTLTWDRRDRDGRRVRAGRYFAILSSGGRSRTRPVACTE